MEIISKSVFPHKTSSSTAALPQLYRDHQGWLNNPYMFPLATTGCQFELGAPTKHLACNKARI